MNEKLDKVSHNSNFLGYKPVRDQSGSQTIDLTIDNLHIQTSYCISVLLQQKLDSFFRSAFGILTLESYRWKCK